jgi:hypothetical protein
MPVSTVELARARAIVNAILGELGQEVAKDARVFARNVLQYENRPAVRHTRC